MAAGGDAGSRAAAAVKRASETMSFEASFEEALRRHHDELFEKLDERLARLKHELLEHAAAGPAMPSVTLSAPRPSGLQQPHVAHSSLGRARSTGALGHVQTTRERPSWLLHRAATTDVIEEAVSAVKSGRISKCPSVAPVKYSFEDSEGLTRSTRTSAVLQRGRRTLDTVTRSKYFELFWGCISISNAIFIGVQTDFDAMGRQSQHGVMRGIDIGYTGIFALELALRIAAERAKFFYKSPTLYWNYLDTIIVFTTFVDLAVTIFGAVGNGGTTGSDTSQLRVLRIIRLTRLVRIVRIPRIVRFIRALRTMVHQLSNTMKSLMWALTLLFIVLYVFSISLTQAVTMHRMGVFSDRETLLTPTMEKYWSTVPRSMYTLFCTVTGGISWMESAEPLLKVGWGSVVMYILYLSFTQLAVLNVITGVFCQNAIDSAAHDEELAAQAMLDEKGMYMDKFRRLFAEFDDDGSMTLSIDEFTTHLQDERVKAYFQSMQLDVEDVRMLFNLIATDGRGGSEIELDEFVMGCMRLRGEAKNIDMAKLIYSTDTLLAKVRRYFAFQDEKMDFALASLQEIVAAFKHRPAVPPAVEGEEEAAEDARRRKQPQEPPPVVQVKM